MATTCTKCGVVLSMPGEACQQCGNPIIQRVILPSMSADPGITLIPRTPPPISRTPTSDFVPLTAPPELRHEGPRASFASERFAEPRVDSKTLPVDLHSEEEEGVKVEHLLGQIAAQSHFEERYELRGVLARGGMGQVHRAFDRILRREVAIKMMLDGAADQPRAAAIRGQFLKESRVGGRLLHPNILSVFDLGVNRSAQIYYTMRLVDGASLQDCLDSLERGVNTKLVAFPLKKIIDMLMRASLGVDFAHQNGVIHLDLKPQNILVSGFQEVFVIDWGLARVDDIDDREALIGLYRDRTNHHLTVACTAVDGTRVVGTPGYMAPEQARGDYANFTSATDVYGLGGVLYFILYGKAPNQGSNIAEIIHSCSNPKKRSKLRTGILPRGQRIRKESQASVESLESICLKALEIDPAKSYETVESMIVDLNDWLAQTPFEQ